MFLLWAAAGVFAFYAHLTLSEASLAAMSAYDRATYLALPGWFSYAYGLATLPALAGSVALLMRSTVARPLYLASLLGVIIQFGWAFGATDLIAVKGAAATVPFPLFIAAMAVLQIWVAGLATGRGWLR
ncbi:MAG: hypothetical protein B7Y45_02840 [Sphingomonas sp. 28-66-16]|nr:MAG: hypothetical protein B7Y45_02840 [Sphingomonas sp. 28-66-16]